MVAEQRDTESLTQAQASHLKDVSADHAQQTLGDDVRCSEDGSRCLSQKERRAIGRRVIAERQGAFAILETYDSR
jgi:hypothetical protein